MNDGRQVQFTGWCFKCEGCLMVGYDLREKRNPFQCFFSKANNCIRFTKCWNNNCWYSTARLELSITSINLFMESVNFKISEFMKKDSTIFLVHRDNYKVFTMCLIPQKRSLKKICSNETYLDCHIPKLQGNVLTMNIR